MSELTTKDALLERAVAALEKLKDSISVISPVGVVQTFAGSTVPDGWLLCDGSAVSRTDYADLYAVVGDVYGSGDGSTTFNLPNLIDRFVEGSATAGTVKNAGLPNITGDYTLRKSGTSGRTIGALNGAFNLEDTELSFSALAFQSGSTATADKVLFDASRSSAIYGNSTTVQPPALTMRYIIKY